MTNTRRICFTALLLVAFETAGATTIYKSVDDQGRITFSDQPPAEGEVVEVVEYRESPPRTSALDSARIEAMREVTDRMAADRREREASRAQARAAPQAPAYDAAGAAPGYYSGYYPYPVYRERPHRPGFRPPHARPPGTRPPGARPPGARPPGARPPGARPPSSRPDWAGGFNQYPANLVRRHYTSAARRVFYRE